MKIRNCLIIFSCIIAFWIIDENYRLKPKPKITREFGLWLATIENPRNGQGLPDDLMILISIKGLNHNKQWHLTMTSLNNLDSNRLLLLRVLQLIREADIIWPYEQVESEILEIKITTNDRHFYSKIPFSIVKNNIQATNLLLLLENTL